MLKWLQLSYIAYFIKKWNCTDARVLTVLMNYGPAYISVVVVHVNKPIL